MKKFRITWECCGFYSAHCCATSTKVLLGGGVYEHDNRNVNVEEILIYEQIIRIT